MLSSLRQNLPIEISPFREMILSDCQGGNVLWRKNMRASSLSCGVLNPHQEANNDATATEISFQALGLEICYL